VCGPFLLSPNCLHAKIHKTHLRMRQSGALAATLADAVIPPAPPISSGPLRLSSPSAGCKLLSALTNPDASTNASTARPSWSIPRASGTETYSSPTSPRSLRPTLRATVPSSACACRGSHRHRHVRAPLHNARTNSGKLLHTNSHFFPMSVAPAKCKLTDTASLQFGSAERLSVGTNNYLPIAVSSIDE
jgi:hypothetical protein